MKAKIKYFNKKLVMTAENNENVDIEIVISILN